MPYQILVVDDDREFCQEMSECLEYYRVIEAASGEQALAILKKPHAIDLVILDVVMPGLSGLDTLKQIKKLIPTISIVMLTGQSSKEVAIEALKGRADDYLEKPFEMEKFFTTIRKVLESRKQNSLGYINKMDRVKSFIERNTDKKINLEHAAQEVCLSAKYLSRLFKENTGLGFNEYRLKIKIQKAQELLKKTNITIEQIAIQLGYQYSESFIRIFEKHTGLTPTEFRLKHKNRRRS